MPISIWIDNESHGLKLGAAGYLVETLNTNTGKARWSVRERPLRAKNTGEPRLTGECEKSGNHVRVAHGVILVVQANGAESRVRIMSLQGARLAEFLRSDGFPELIPEGPVVDAGHGDAERGA